MEKLEEKLTGKKSCADEEPTTAGTIMEKLSDVDDATKESAEENTNPNILEVDQAQNIERSINRHDDEDEANLNNCRYEHLSHQLQNYNPWHEILMAEMATITT